jgi:hypothetical protein
MNLQQPKGTRITGLEAEFINFLIRFGRATLADKNVDDLITEGRDILRRAKYEL